MTDLYKYGVGVLAGFGLAYVASHFTSPSAVARAENLFLAAEQDGALLSACNYAGLVAEEWGAAGRPEKYSEWKATERSICVRADLAESTHSSQYR